MDESHASGSAVLVCKGRAVADGQLAVGRFSDPIAIDLLTESERREVELARGPVPSRWQDRWQYELLRATAEILAARTPSIDDAVRASGCRQAVILGAGLDARVWRLPELAGATVFEVDHPASQADKRQRAKDLPLPTSVRYVPVDFTRDELGEQLAKAGHDRDEPTVWIWEGVLPYLNNEQADTTLAAIQLSSAPRSRLIATYSDRVNIPATSRLFLRVLSTLTRRNNPLQREPQISAWSAGEMRALLDSHGMSVISDVDQLTCANDLEITPRRASHLQHSHIVVAELRG